MVPNQEVIEAELRFGAFAELKDLWTTEPIEFYEFHGSFLLGASVMALTQSFNVMN
jgi:hypothetical protein